MQYEIGTILYRKYGNKKKVKIINIDKNNITIIDDSNMSHFININKVDEFFILLEPEEIKIILDTAGSNPK